MDDGSSERDVEERKRLDEEDDHSVDELEGATMSMIAFELIVVVHTGIEHENASARKLELR